MARTIRLIALILAALAPSAVLAQAYGQAPYGTLAYGNGVISIGGITLPNTGATWFAFGVILFVAAGAAVYVYRWSRHFFTRPQG